MHEYCLRGHVSGRVQGVWFRAFVQRHARELGVEGWARNRADGRVEVLLCGRREQVEALVAQLHLGPPLARVEQVELSPVEGEEPRGFITL